MQWRLVLYCIKGIEYLNIHNLPDLANDLSEDKLEKSRLNAPLLSPLAFFDDVPLKTKS